MFGGGNSPSLADIAAVTKNNDGNDGMGGWGNGWWVLIILFALFGGWGGNWGNNGGRNGNGCDSGSSVTVVEVPGARSYMGGYGMGYGFENAALQRGFDNQTVISKLDGLGDGISSLGYDQLAQMNNIGTQIMQTGFGLQQAINNDTVANMQNTNALSRQLSECCCDNRAAIKDLQYNMATQNCATNNNIHQTGDAIIQSQNQGFQMLQQTIQQGFCNMEMREMQRENQALRDRLQTCDMNSALQGTASYIINTVRPTPIPSWLVENPWAGCNCGNGYGYSRSGCCNN